MTQRDDEYEDVDYEGTEESRDDFFGMSDADDEYYEERPHINWVSVFSVLLAIVVAIVLCIVGVRALFSANQDAEYEGKSWVIEGSYVDLTPDLETDSNVAQYKGNLPKDNRIDGMKYRSNLKDTYEVHAGENIDFRGTQTGTYAQDFPREVSALVAETSDHQIEVVRTGEKGSVKAIEQGSVGQQYLVGWGSFALALVVLIGGCAFGIWSNRRSRVDYVDVDGFEESDDYEEDDEGYIVEEESSQDDVESRQK